MCLPEILLPWALYLQNEDNIIFVRITLGNVSKCLAYDWYIVKGSINGTPGTYHDSDTFNEIEKKLLNSAKVFNENNIISLLP